MAPAIRTACCIVLALLAAAGIAACDREAGPPPPTEAPSVATAPADAPAVTPAADGGVTPLLDLDTEQYLDLHRAWHGDYDAVASGERRFIRALVPYSRTLYFLSQAEQAGVAFEALREFERALAAKAPKGATPPRIVIIPTSRDRLLPALAEGLGDIAVGGLTITPERARLVAFSVPTLDDVREVLVTGKADPRPVTRIEDLAGREIHVRRSSSYHHSLTQLAGRLKAAGLDPPHIIDADELLETEDLLQMVDAGVIPATVADAHIARAWAGAYDGIAVHEDIVLSSGGHLAWAVRQDAPQLLAAVNDFVRRHREGTLFGNVLLKRYLDPAARLRNPGTAEEVRRFRAIVDYLKRYAGQYDFDWLLIGAQAYQESQLDNARRSAAGAVGVMQIKPATAADMGIRDIRPVDRNIEAGVKYLRFMTDRYFDDPGIDRLNRTLLAMASYNAGPARVAQLRQEAGERGLDPNVWFRNVEVVAARRIGRETVDYVSNIYKYYVAYKAISAAEQARQGRDGGG